MFQFQAKFIKDYAFDVAPLRQNLKLALQTPLRTQLSLTTPALEAFNSIKRKIADIILNKKRLYFPKWNRPLFVETDASQFAVGGWVWQYDTDEPIEDSSKLTSLIRPVAYVSRALKDHEVRW